MKIPPRLPSQTCGRLIKYIGSQATLMVVAYFPFTGAFFFGAFWLGLTLVLVAFLFGALYSAVLLEMSVFYKGQTNLKIKKYKIYK